MSEDRYRHLFDFAPIAFVLLDRTGRIITLNHAAAALLKADRTWCERKPLALFVAREYQEALTNHLRRVFDAESRASVELQLVNRFGDQPWARLESRHHAEKDAETLCICAIIDITDRKQVEDDLLIAKEEAIAANRAKSAFLAEVSHEIRTPLNGILAVGELALNSDAGPRSREYLEVIYSSARSLVTVADDVLDISLVEADRIPLRMESFDPAQLMQTLEAMYRPSAARKGLRLSFDLRNTVSRAVLGDVNRMRQVMINLLNNALEYTIEGTISVVLSEDRLSSFLHELTFEVADSGPGMPADEAGSEPWSSGMGSRQGLSISRRLAKLMGGQVYFVGGQAEGTTVRFSVPVQLPPPSTVGTVAEAATATGPIPGTAKAVAGLHILVAEDNHINELALRTILEHAGHTVVSSRDGTEALRTLAQEQFDLVLMDISMPGLDGLTATEMIRSGRVERVAPDIPIVAISAHSMKGDRERFLSAGMNDYIAKPFSQRGVLEVVGAFRRRT